MCLVADQGKASQYSKLKISTKLCYEEHVPSRYVKEMSVQLPPLASPMRQFPTSKADVSYHLAFGWPYTASAAWKLNSLFSKVIWGEEDVPYI